MEVAGSATLQIEVIKGRALAGLVLFPRPDDLPPMARPFSAGEKTRAAALAREGNIDKLQESAPISVIGTCPTLNDAVENGPAPGVIQVTFLAPVSAPDAAGIGKFAREQ